MIYRVSRGARKSSVGANGFFFEFFLSFGVLSSKRMYQKIHYLNDCSRLVVQLQQGVVPGTPRYWRSLKDS
jgi:hypothetical protein